MITSGIVCTTDFSESSKEALKWSIETAKRMGSHLTILHTYRLIKQSNGSLPAKSQIDEEASKEFKNLEDELLAGSGVQYDLKIEVGFVDDRIEELLKTHKASFLVMGKGMTLRNKESFDDLVKQLQIPLVIIP